MREARNPVANFAFNDKYEGSMCHRKAKVRTLRAFRTKESDGGREDSKGESRRTGGECRDKKKSNRRKPGPEREFSGVRASRGIRMSHPHHFTD